MAVLRWRNSKEYSLNMPRLICVNEKMFNKALGNWVFKMWYDALPRSEKEEMERDRSRHAAARVAGITAKTLGKVALAALTGFVSFGSDVEHQAVKDFNPQQYESLFELLYTQGIGYIELKSICDNPLVERTFDN